MWSFQNVENAGDIVKELSKQSDRGAALIAQSILESTLEGAIRGKFTRSKIVEDRLFKGTGPLVSFSAKIDLGFSLGLYPEDARRTFHRIKEIRNSFAHSAEPLSFETKRIKDICVNFHSAATWFKAFSTPAFKEFKPKAQMQAIKKTASKWARCKDTPRSRYEATICWYVMILNLILFADTIKAGQSPSLHILPAQLLPQKKTGSPKPKKQKLPPGSSDQ